MSGQVVLWQDLVMAQPADPSDGQYVQFRPRNVASVAALLVGMAIGLGIIWAARAVLVWMLAGAVLAMALNPGVEWFRRHGVKSRGAAVAIVFFIFLGILVAAGALIIPTLVRQITGFINAVPGYVDDITHGRGPLGFLETKYHVVERVQKEVNDSGGAKLFAHAGVLVSVGKGIVSFLTTSLTIITFTLFMLLEGPAWVERVLTALPEPRQSRLRALNKEIYRTAADT
jgi:predicted PurR-regulated permease PerM